MASGLFPCVVHPHDGGTPIIVTDHHIRRAVTILAAVEYGVAVGADQYLLKDEVQIRGEREAARKVLPQLVYAAQATIGPPPTTCDGGSSEIHIRGVMGENRVEIVAVSGINPRCGMVPGR